MEIPDSNEQAENPSPAASKTERLTYGNEIQQFGELYVPHGAGPHPVVILIHGGFWRVPYGFSLMTGLAEDLARKGIAAWNIEYRRVGEAGGGWPGTLQDVANAADHLKHIAPSHALDLGRVVAVGHSAGGHLALWLAARPRLGAESDLLKSSSPLHLAGAVSLAGAVDLELTWRLRLGNDAATDLLGGGPDDVPERYAAASPAALLPLGVPQVLIHGTKDDRVPLVVSRSYASQALAAGDQVVLIELAGADHFVLIDATSTAWSITIEEIQKLLTQG